MNGCDRSSFKTIKAVKNSTEVLNGHVLNEDQRTPATRHSEYNIINVRVSDPMNVTTIGTQL